MRNSVIGVIKDCAKRDESVFLITGDAGYGILDEYKTNFPGRFLNLGVAEQNMIGFSAGLALVGHKVFVYNIIPFLLYRCYEQVRNDICYQQLPVTLIGIGSGVTYAPQGVTHYSIEDISITRTLPNLVVFSPADPMEAVKCAEFASQSQKPVYIRIAKSDEPVLHKNEIKDITKPLIIKEGKEYAVLFHGSIGIEVMKALENLENPPLVISIPLIQPIDFNFLFGILKNTHTLITVEEHFIDGGLGSIIADWIVREGLHFKLKKLGIRNEFIHVVKDNSGMRSFYGIASDSIKNTFKEVLASA